MNQTRDDSSTKRSEANAFARGRLLSLPREPLFYADWERAVFLHYEVDPHQLQRDVPFALDLRDGRAYVSLVAFTMRHMRPRVGGLLARWLFWPIATQEFLNVRTYVHHRGESGIYFLAEWLSNRWSVRLGPRSFGLPYRFGHLHYKHDYERGELRGEASNSTGTKRLNYRAGCNLNPQPDERFMDVFTALEPTPSPPRRGAPTGVAEPSSPPKRGTLPNRTLFHSEPGALLGGAGSCFRESREFRTSLAGTLEEFLLERYTAFTKHDGTEQFFRIWHPPWPKTPLDATIEENSLLTANWPWFSEARLIGANYSPGVKDVWMGWPHRIAKLAARAHRRRLTAFWEMP